MSLPRKHSRVARCGGVLALATGLLTGCVSIRTTAPDVTPRPPTIASETSWLAGAAEIDITPPPGYAMGGHSTEGAIALGVWTRLRAQAIYVEDRHGVPLVLVVCDLWAVEPGLVDRIAERLAEHPGLAHIGREHLIVAATHTHHSPAMFSTSRIYSAFAATEGGHDPVLFEALSGKIAAAIAEAVAARRPATIDAHTVAVPAVARNRSVAALLADPEMPALVRSNAPLPGCLGAPSAAGIDPCHAIDPRLEALEFTDATTGDRIALAGVFAMHPTAMPNITELYHSDVFGIATARAQARLTRPDAPAPVVALFNGAQGDVSPNWDPQGRPSTVELGHALGEALVAAVDVEGEEIEGTIDVAFGWRPLAKQRFEDADGKPRRTARRALSGKGQFGGAEDGRTRLYEHGFREGRRRKRPRNNGHGIKKPIAPWPLGALAPLPGSTPKEVPLGVVRLGSLALLTFPGEVTTVLGHRITAQVEAVLPEGTRSIALGLAGGYLSYFTTREEYGEQHYEGASMLYGEDAGTLLGHHLSQLARDGTVEVPTTRHYRPGRVRRWSFGRERIKLLPEVEWRLPLQLDTDVLANMPHIFVWDAMPTWPTDDPHALTTIRTRIETHDPERGWHDLVVDGVPVDDRSGALVASVTHAKDERFRWGVWWLQPQAGHQQSLRFRVDTVGGTPQCSQVFTIGRWLNPVRSRWLETSPCTTAAPDGDPNAPSK